MSRSVNGLVPVIVATLLGLLVAITPAAARAADAGKKDKRPGDWLTSFSSATKFARSADKPILAYFNGSDWCDFCKKLDREVLNTGLFLDWAKQNVILLDIDYPARKRISPSTKRQNENLKIQYNIAKTPTFILMDADGEVLARCGYDSAALRPEEPKGRPEQWIKWLDNALKNRPKPHPLVTYKTIEEGAAVTKKNGLPLLLLITKGDTPVVKNIKEGLLKSQKFVRWVNGNMPMVILEWPADSDVSEQALAFRKFAEDFKIGPAAVQLVVLEAGGKKFKNKFTAIDVNHMDALLKQLTKEMPKYDYTGRWLEDWRMARAISVQTERELFVSFISSDSSEWSKRIHGEIYDTEEFKQYARKNLVLLKVDFPKAKPQSDALKEQNRMLAEMYNIRGYPAAVILNPSGQKIGEAKYMKGGPIPFLAELDRLKKEDYERRTLISDEVVKGTR